MLDSKLNAFHKFPYKFISQYSWVYSNNTFIVPTFYQKAYSKAHYTTKKNTVQYS